MQTPQNQTKTQAQREKSVSESQQHSLDYESLLSENPYITLSQDTPLNLSNTQTILQNPFLSIQTKASNPFIDAQTRINNPFIAENAKAPANPFTEQKEDETEEAEWMLLPESILQKQGSSIPEEDENKASPQLETEIQQSRGKGSPLDTPIRNDMERSFGADFGTVRLHTDSNATQLSQNIQAEAFTVGQDIYFNEGRYQPNTKEGKQLLAHELTYTIQQTNTNTRPERIIPSDTADTSIQRRIEIPGFIATPLDSALANLPGYRLATVLIGFNPVTNQTVERNPENILRGLMGIAPGGEQLFLRLQSSGVIAKAVEWLQAEISKLNISLSVIEQCIQQAIDNFSILNPLESITNAFRPVFNRITSFARNVAHQVLKFIKETLLPPVANYLKENFAGYELLTVIIGFDPVTGEPVQRNPENFVKGFLKLIHREDIWQNLQQSGALQRAYAWYQVEIEKLNLTRQGIQALFTRAWDSLSLADIASPLSAVERIVHIFAPPVQRIAQFARSAVQMVLELIFEGAMGAGGARIIAMLRQAGAVFNQIVENPVGFLSNLINAIKTGFQQFAGNILTHLQRGLIDWLTGTLGRAGIQLPDTWDFRGILSLVMQVLGITYDRMRMKLVERLGEDNVRRLEQTVTFVQRLVNEGPVAVWNQLQAYLQNLQSMIFDRIRDWIMTQVVQAAVIRIMSMFNPVGAVIQSILAIYNTLMFFMERAQQLFMVIDSIVQSIARIAAGNIAEAANFIEQSLGRAIPVVLSFLARLLGLGDIAERIQTILQSVQDMVSNAIDRVIDWIIAQAGRLLNRNSPHSPSAHEDNAERNSPEQNNNLTRGVEFLLSADRQYTTNPSLANAQKVAQDTKRNHPVFQEIRVVEDENSFDYQYRTAQNQQFQKVETGTDGERVQRMAKPKSKRIEGGGYGQLIDLKTSPKEERHHIPSKKSIEISGYSGVTIFGTAPCVIMEYDDHRKTPSWGSSGKSHSEKLAKIITDGGNTKDSFKKAQEEDLRLTPQSIKTKYLSGINQMLAYTNSL